ncbi:ester cyclase [Pararhizobium sp. BT-229]|uniref:ester cyclase n=1 Tax=Pararhizobium sp. BT-229 TaxID=2986923 RepID=UPI0021F7CF78|nr:ester cyclase [Pararhizobium sp. BT-229]MCV9966705.1 ester cyclase [Pararhizobium sp. BT-229]
MPANNTASQENIALMRNAFAALSSRDFTSAAEFLSPDFIINLAGMPYQMRGRRTWRKNTETFLNAFPDFQLETQDMFATDDKVAVRFRMTGTHTGEFLGNQPTGKRVDYQSYELYRIADGKIAEEWICSDMLTILTQIGAFPARHLLLMWLAGYRVWFAAGLGLLAGVILTLSLSFVSS